MASRERSQERHRSVNPYTLCRIGDTRHACYAQRVTYPPRKTRTDPHAPRDLGVDVPDDLDLPTYDRPDATQDALQRAKRRPRALTRPSDRSLVLDDPAALQGIVDRLRRGMPLKLVAQAIGVSWQTWRAWEARGAEGIEPYASAMLACRTAAAEGVLSLLDDVRRAGEGAPDKDGIWKNQWQASKWLAERIEPELAREPVQASVHVEVSEGQSLDLSRLSTEELADLMVLTSKAGVGGEGGALLLVTERF